MKKRTLKYIFLFAFFFLSLNFVFSSTTDGEFQEYTYKDSVEASIILDSCWANRTKNPILALKFGENALELIEKKEITPLKCKTLNFIGVVYRKLGHLQKSHEYFKYALNLAKALDDQEQIGYTYNNLGDYYLNKASYSLALENVLKAYNVFEKLNHKMGMAYSLNYMGEIYIKHKDYEKATQYLLDAAKIRKEQNDMRGYVNSIVNVGETYFAQGEFIPAKKQYGKAIKICKEIKYTKGLSRIVSLLGDISFSKNKFIKAKKSYNYSLELDRKISNKFGVINNLNKLGLVYLQMNKFKLAKQSFNRALNLARESLNLDQEMISYLNLSNLESAQNDFKSAHKNLLKYITLKDSIYSHESMGKFADLQTLFITNKKEAENEILKKELEIDKITYKYLIIILIITLLAIVLLFSRSRSQKNANRLLKELNDSKDKFFSILAHDLKNPFQGLLGYTDLLENDYDSLDENEVRESIKSLHSVTRNVYQLLEGLLEWSRAQTGRIEYNPTLFAISEEATVVVELLNDNAKSKNIKLFSSIDSSLKVYADRNMVNTIIRNLTANAIKFSNSGDSIEIKAHLKNRFVVVTVEDHGVGMRSDEVNNLFRIDVHQTTLGTQGEEGTGVGLILCKELVESNKGNIWAESELGKGSKFNFSLPITNS